MAMFVNASVETVEQMFDNKMYVFEKRKSINIPDHLAFFVEREMSQFGVFRVDYTKSILEQEDAALKNYLDYLYQRRSYYNSWKDEQKRHGITIAEDSVQSKKVELLIKQLEERFGVQRLHEDFTFKDAESIAIADEKKELPIDLDAEVSKELASKPRRGRQKKIVEEVTI